MKGLIGQAIAFIGLSGIGWLLDFGVYSILGFFSENLVVNNTVSSWAGVTFVFFFATGKVFKSNGRIPLKWKYLIYLFYQCVLIFRISKLLNVINVVIINYITFDVILRFSSIIAKILVTPITMILNFFVMKGIIERL